jgi:hypothetical protein
MSDRVRHFVQCDICSGLGHIAKDCGLREMEERQDPQGELARRESYRTRERERIAKKQAWLASSANVQTSRGFGM